MPEHAPWLSYLAIVLAALATYVLRSGGLLLAGRLPRNVRFQRAMEALPGSLMFSIVVPSAIAEGGWSIAATILTALTAYTSGNVFLAMIVGMGFMLVERHLLS